MKTRPLALLVGFMLVALPAMAQPAAPVLTATTLKKSTVTVGSAIVSLAPNTKLEVLGREGDALIVKFRSTKGKVPLADTDYNPETVLPAAAAPATPETAKVVAPAAKPAPPAPAKPATPPALNTSGTGQQPATNYGKAVQKARQASEAHKSTHVDPTKDILDEDPPKKK
jgi:hypothetical protein